MDDSTFEKQQTAKTTGIRWLIRDICIGDVVYCGVALRAQTWQRIEDSFD